MLCDHHDLHTEARKHNLIQNCKLSRFTLASVKGSFSQVHLLESTWGYPQLPNWFKNSTQHPSTMQALPIEEKQSSEKQVPATINVEHREYVPEVTSISQQSVRQPFSETMHKQWKQMSHRGRISKNYVTKHALRMSYSFNKLGRVEQCALVIEMLLHMFLPLCFLYTFEAKVSPVLASIALSHLCAWMGRSSVLAHLMLWLSLCCWERSSLAWHSILPLPSSTTSKVSLSFCYSFPS